MLGILVCGLMGLLKATVHQDTCTSCTSCSSSSHPSTLPLCQEATQWPTKPNSVQPTHSPERRGITETNGPNPATSKEDQIWKQRSHETGRACREEGGFECASGDPQASTATSTVKAPREPMRQEQAEQTPWVALGRLFLTLDSASFLKEFLGKLKDQALNLQSLSYSRTKYAALNCNSPLAPHLNMSRFFPDPHNP